jgi:hypothetical protein
MSKTKTRIADDSTVSPSRLKMAIQHCTTIKHPLMIWGAPGIGKSDIVAEVAREQKRPLIDIRLPLLEPTDLRGIPHLIDIKITSADGKILRDDHGVELTEKLFKWSNPSDLPTDPLSNALVFFDEMSAASPSVQVATYQIILNRKIGDYTLPDNVVIVAAGNRVKDKGVAYNMPLPLGNRFSHLTLAVDFDDWQEWALLNRVHQDIVGYLSFCPGDLNQFGADVATLAFATPRSWSFVDKIISSGSLPDEVLSDLIKGTVGDGPGFKFMTYRKSAANLPAARDILEGKVTKLALKQIDIMYALTTSLCYGVVDSFKRAEKAGITSQEREQAVVKAHADTDNFLRFTMDNFEDELTVMGAKTLLSVHKIQMEAKRLKNWKEFCSRFKELIPSM